MSLYPVSWSKLNLYLTCPRKYYHERVLRDIVQPESESMIWGNEVHKALEDQLVSGKPLEARFKAVQPLVDKASRIPGEHYAELKLAVNTNLQGVDYDSPSAYVRCIIDRLIIWGREGANLDWKTGKRKPFSRQLTLSAGITFGAFPEVDELHSAYVWTQGGKPTVKSYRRNEMTREWECFQKDIENMEWSHNNNAWPPKPSGLCIAWCEVFSCPHNGRRSRNG